MELNLKMALFMVPTFILNSGVLFSPISYSPAWGIATVIGYALIIMSVGSFLIRELPNTDSRSILMWEGIYIFWIIYLFAYVYKFFGLMPTNESHAQAIHNGAISLYFSCITFTTLGFGDYVPASNYTRVAASIEAISGYVFFGLFIAAIIRSFGKERHPSCALHSYIEAAKKRDEVKDDEQ